MGAGTIRKTGGAVNGSLSFRNKND